MYRSLLTAIILLSALLNCRAVSESESLPVSESLSDNYFQWSKFGDIPDVDSSTDQHGLAGHFAKVYNNTLIIGGGANFPNTPVAEGGAKVWHNDLYILSSIKSTDWNTNLKLPYNWAYGVAVATPKGIVVIGGQNETGDLDKVIRIKPDGDHLDVESLPSLPLSISSMSGGIIDNIVVITGGVQNGEVSNRTFVLDLSKEKEANFGWIEAEEMPTIGRVGAAYSVQNGGDRDLLYLFGGFNNSPSLDRSVVLTDGLSYDPVSDEWSTLGEIYSDKSPVALNGAAAIPYGPTNILFFGAANYDIFSSAILRGDKIREAKSSGDTVAIERLNREAINYLKQPIESYKFSKIVLSYNTITNRWVELDDYQFTAPAVAAATSWSDKIFIVNGEKKPGIRNRDIICLEHNEVTSFGAVNYIVLIAYLLSMLGLGFYFMRRAKNTDQFFKGGGSIPWWAAGISIFATSLSAITFMAIPAKTYATDWLYFPMIFSTFIVAPIIIKWFLPFFRKLNLTSAYEYLEYRFNPAARSIASILFLIFMVARIAIVLYLPSLALSTVSGMDIYFCIGIMAVITMIYCTMGGVEAVIWGDVIQGIILVIGALLSIVVLVIKTGGINETISIAIEANKLDTFNFALSFKEPTFWVIFFGAGLANSLIPYTSDQSLIQRYMTTETEEKAAKSIWLNGIISLPIGLIFYFIGTALYSYYSKMPATLDPDMPNTGGIFPFFIMSELPVGVAGLLIAAIFAATMSTLSSNINSVSTAFTTDFYTRFKPESSDKSRMKVARLSGIVCGTVGMTIALMMVTMNIKSFFDQFNTIIGLLSSGLAGLFIMGIFCKSISGKGAITGLVGSLIILLLVKNFTSLHFMLYGLIGVASSVIIGYVVSKFLPKDTKDISELTL